MELQTTALTDAQPKMRKSKLARAAKRASARAEAAAKAAGEAAEHADPDSRPEADPVAADEAADTLRGLSLSEASDEPLLKPNPRRFVLFPIQFHDVWQAYKNAEANFWSAEEVEMSDDLDDFESLSRKEQSFILQAVSSLCVGSGVATETILSRFSDEIQIPEARCFFGFELMQKNIHGELCTVVLDMLSPTEQQRDDLVDVILQCTPVARLLPSRIVVC
nr:Ribonucleoside-diphosphate reductase subunit M2 [Polyrhizophydium stewartii]